MKDFELPPKEEPEEKLHYIPTSEYSKVIMNIEGDGVRFHTVEDIGRYTVFPKNHWKRMFPTDDFGNIEKDEVQYNDAYGIMTREEGLRITNELARLRLPHERNINYKEMIE